MKRFLWQVSVLLCVLLAGPVLADWTPTKPIRFIVPYGTGGFGDTSARLAAEKLAPLLGQPILVENRAAGASGSVGTEAGAKAAPDGYTWTLGADPAFTIGPNMLKVGYDPIRDFIPVSLIGTSPHTLIVNASLPVNSFPELAALARAKPNQLSMGSAGNGTASHIVTELFRAAGIEVLHVPYKAQAPAITDLLAGRIDMTIGTLPSAEEQLKAGRLKALAVSAARRNPRFPEVPTFREMGYAAFETKGWTGILVPAGTPREVVLRIQAEVAKVLAMPDIQTRFAALGYEPPNADPNVLREIINTSFAQYGAVIRKAGIKPE